MKDRLFIAVLCLALFCVQVAASSTSGSLSYADSYILRAKGIEALYWNPAALSLDHQELILPGSNLMVWVYNNSFDLETYNRISGRYLTESDKAEILGKVDEALKLNSEARFTVVGLTFGNVAFATGVRAVADGSLSEDCLRLVLYGNEDTDYAFDKKENQVSGLVYQDFTIGFGDWDITQYAAGLSFPAIRVGASISGLIGFGAASTEKFSGFLHSGLDGLALDQQIVLRTGIGGIGAKGMIGMRSEPLCGLLVGLTLDNIYGHIRWFGDKDLHTYRVASDSVYVSNIEEDIFNTEAVSENTGNFTTTLPPEFRIGALYGHGRANLSADWALGFADSQITKALGVISLAAEYYPLPQFPLQFGVKFGNSNEPVSFSYGLVFRSRYFEAGLGCRTWGSLFPGYTVKGFSAATNLKIHL